MNSLWVRQALAFGAVILALVGAIAWLADLQAGAAFRDYVVYSRPVRYPPLVSKLAEYYTAHKGWDGVATVIETPGALPQTPESGLPTLYADPHSPNDPPIDRRLRVVLAGPNGRVVYDNTVKRTGRALGAEERAAAEDVKVDNSQVGYLLISIPWRAVVPGPLEAAYEQRFRGILVGGALTASVVGLLLSLLLSRSMSAPLMRLADASRALANRDFSHRVKVEGSREIAAVGAAFNDMAGALDQSEKQRRSLVADVAHELRTPLSVLQGSLSAMLDGVFPLDKAEIARLYDESRLLSRLVEDLRELAQADAGELRVNLRPVDPTELVRNTVESLAPVAEMENTRLEVRLPEQLPLVQADPDRLVQVLRNLLVNALKFTPSGGVVSVSAAPVDRMVEFAVSDTGKGIAPEDLPHVFDRFWRGDRSRARSEQAAGGSGLGLAVAQSFVHAQGGRIWVESTLDQGATFRFTLTQATSVE